MKDVCRVIYMAVFGQGHRGEAWGRPVGNRRGWWTRPRKSQSGWKLLFYSSAARLVTQRHLIPFDGESLLLLLRSTYTCILLAWFENARYSTSLPMGFSLLKRRGTLCQASRHWSVKREMTAPHLRPHVVSRSADELKHLTVDHTAIERPPTFLTQLWLVKQMMT